MLSELGKRVARVVPRYRSGRLSTAPAGDERTPAFSGAKQPSAGRWTRRSAPGTAMLCSSRADDDVSELAGYAGQPATYLRIARQIKAGLARDVCICVERNIGDRVSLGD